MEQAEILKRFIERVQAMKVRDQNGEDNFANDFMRLRRLSTKYRTEKIYPTNTGEKEENVKKNRYKDILPFDHSRVKLALKTSQVDSDYINANFIKGVYGPNSYIATQGPLANTVLDFWRMIWEYNVAIIVVACREFEMGRKKCERYWPIHGDGPLRLGEFLVTCEAEQARNDYFIRTLLVEFQNESRRLYQFHYINWPDHDVPSSFDSILDMISLMREYQDHEKVPICIHCSAGCGRTGAICAIDYTWNLLKAGKIPEEFSVYSLIQEMRTQRHSAVQTKEQYELVHRAIAQLFEKELQRCQCTESPNTDEISTENTATSSVAEKSDMPPPKPPRVRSCLVEGDAKEEILQPPEPQPVPPILTPSPPSAYPAVTTVWQDNDRYHPKPVVHLFTQSHATDLNENFNKPADTFKQVENCPSSHTESIEKKLERKLSIEIKKIPLQEGPKSFEMSPPGGNGSFNRTPLTKAKSTSVIEIEKICKSEELNSVNSQVDTLQHSCATQEVKSQLNSDVLQRPVQLPLKERAQASWNMQSVECTPPAFSKSSTADKLFKTECQSSPAPALTAETSSKETPVVPPVTVGTSEPCANPPPLSFTNPLHSDDSEPEEMDVGTAIPKSISSVLSATVTSTMQNETPSVRKISPLSIAREQPSNTLNLRADKHSGDKEDNPPPLPERTPESFVVASEPDSSANPVNARRSAEWSGFQQTQSVEHPKMVRSKSLKNPRIQRNEYPEAGDGGRSSGCTGMKATTRPEMGQSAETNSKSRSRGSDLGFNNRYTKPKGPRDPPSEWT
ncbi:tyrosine-protein phosphatase non-receptor type 12 isoform X1 [Callorhinchus milii]|uniref:protein-tyrosine-phosphatase n=1 Tax=Callorhinchus milii TaxID=7868 RepID=A0A4W3IVT4_CALMI|nr:tyrosine-protein phosphatase non-receptor type 12 isoform X1 [Callorhinchus milii]|eukprot:gi/632947534/ref/XP_007889094.1/ PREDICTED: tyrosine-protein phosphatase non-receptor type 12 isoform X1 [Callorhinchus milii]